MRKFIMHAAVAAVALTMSAVADTHGQRQGTGVEAWVRCTGGLPAAAKIMWLRKPVARLLCASCAVVSPCGIAPAGACTCCARRACMSAG